jgi:hypothetical protein
MKLVANFENHRQFFIKIQESAFDKETNTIVNCVDVNSGELVYSWLLVIDPVH